MEAYGSVIASPFVSYSPANAAAERPAFSRSAPVAGWTALSSSRSTRYHTELLEEGKHIEIVAAVLDLASVEVQYPACPRRLAFSGGWNRATRALECSGLRSRPGHLKDHGVSAGDGVADRA